MVTVAADYIVRLIMPENLISPYEKEAERLERPLEEFIVQHLRKTRALVTQEKPLIVTDTDRRRIEAALSKNLTDGSQLADSCEGLAALHIGGLEVHVSEQVMGRLGTRCYGMSLADFVQATVQRLLEVEVGLR